jgi:hypothetical protein
MGPVTLELYTAEERKMTAQGARRGLLIHAAVTVVVVCALVIVNAFVAPESPWSVFAAVGMSLGVCFHWYFGVNRGEEFMIRHQAEVEREA